MPIPVPIRVPALVVSGFLGAGKTTLVRHLLDDAQRRGIRLAVISNEFGALGIDRALLGGDPEAFVELEGGCVCCRLSDELVATLERLHTDVRPDRIVVETSGVALPSETLLHFWREPVCRWLGDDLGIVVINAEQVWEGRDLDGTFADQVSSADLLVLNKVDLVPPAALAAIEARLRQLEPEAPLIQCQNGAVEPDLLFLPEGKLRPRGTEAPRPHSHEAFEAEVLQFPNAVTAAQLTQQLQNLGALRSKGFLWVDGAVQLVQGVGQRIQISLPREAPGPDLVGRLVIIRRTA